MKIEVKTTDLGSGYSMEEYSCGVKRWYLNGKLHRENGPAVEGSNGEKYWYLDGIELSEQRYVDEQKILSLHKENEEMKEFLRLLDSSGILDSCAYSWDNPDNDPKGSIGQQLKNLLK